MDATTFPVMLNFSKIPASPPPDHTVLFKHVAHQPAAAASLSNPHLYTQFARAMEAPTVTVKKAPSLLEKHFQEQQQLREKMKLEEEAQAKTVKLEKDQIQQPQQQQTRHQPGTPTTPTFTSAHSSSTLSSAETKVPATQPQQQQKNHHQTQQAQTQAQQTQLPQKPATSPSAAQRPISPPDVHNTPPNPLLLNNPGLLDPSATSDPKYVQTASRMATYYQQRCQAILNFQQQRCQTWAVSHQQKCQHLMQAAMLVVAWYIRDRISRRRRRDKRTFRRGLREKDALAARTRNGTNKGDAVRRWVMAVPDAARCEREEARSRREVADPEERAFDVEREVASDKDGQLFTVADQMIKAQLAKIDVPLLGALNLDNSDSESEEEEEPYYDYNNEEEEEEEEDDDEDEDDDDDDYEDDDDINYAEESEVYAAELASKEAMHGTGKGSLKRKRSDSDSVVAEERFLNGRREM